MATYYIKHSELSNLVWIDNGSLFKDPHAMNLEMQESGSFAVEVCTVDGAVVGSVVRAQSGWSSYDFKHGGQFGAGIPSGSYKIRIVNKAGGKRTIIGGDLTYAE